MDAMTNVIKDQELRSLFFLSPLLLSGNQRSSMNSARQAITLYNPSGGQQRGEKRTRMDRRISAGSATGQSRGTNKGTGKTSGKDGKGKKSKGGHELMSKTPDGRDLCYNWNAGKECDGKCGRVHACRVSGCMATHRSIDHK